MCLASFVGREGLALGLRPQRGACGCKGRKERTCCLVAGDFCHLGFHDPPAKWGGGKNDCKVDFAVDHRPTGHRVRRTPMPQRQARLGHGAAKPPDRGRGPPAAGHGTRRNRGQGGRGCVVPQPLRAGGGGGRRGRGEIPTVAVLIAVIEQPAGPLRRVRFLMHFICVDSLLRLGPLGLGHPGLGPLGLGPLGLGPLGLGSLGLGPLGLGPLGLGSLGLDPPGLGPLGPPLLMNV